MGQEDVVQEECIGYFDYAIAGAALTVNQARGFGVLTRTGVGTLSVTFPAGKGLPNNRLSIEFTSKEGAGTFAVAVVDTTSTDVIKKIVIMDAAGAAVDNIDGTLKLYRVLP